MKTIVLQRQITWSAVVSVFVLLLLLISYGYVLNQHQHSMLLGAEGQKSKQTPKDATSEEVTICKLQADPSKYNRKLVQVSGFLSHGFEDSGIFDPRCESRFSIWYEYGGKNVTGTMYCCGLTSARTRPEQITVEGISIPLLADENFKTLDRLLHSGFDLVVHGNVIGRFFSGEKSTAADGTVWWNGYGHMGCCSLLMIQQVVKVDSHDRTDLDYRASVDQPNIEQDGCGYKHLMELDGSHSTIAAQKDADTGGQSWAFEDPMRVATETLANLLKRDKSQIGQLRLTRQTQGRMVYQWRPKTERGTYMIVISRPYHLSFYSKTDRVAWVPIAAYRSSCGDDNDATQFKLK
jgi:hypothetical protein